MEIREALKRLNGHPLVDKARFRRQYANGIFDVRFKDGILEHWSLTDDIRIGYRFHFIVPSCRPLFNDVQITTYREFETNPLEPEYGELMPYFMVQHRDIDNAGFAEMRLKVHEIINELIINGWAGFQYPDNALKHDFNEVRKANFKAYWEAAHRLSAYRYKGGPVPGRLLMSHFNNISDIRYKDRMTLREAWNPIPLFHSINHNIKINKDITRSSIIRILTSSLPDGFSISGPRLPNAVIWCAIFEKLKLRSIVDFDYNFGEKAIAAAACGIGYTTNAGSTKLIDFVGARSQPANITIINSTQPLSDDKLSNAIKAVQTSEVVAIVTKNQSHAISPMAIYEIRTEPIMVDPKLNILIHFKIADNQSSNLLRMNL